MALVSPEGEVRARPTGFVRPREDVRRAARSIGCWNRPERARPSPVTSLVTWARRDANHREVEELRLRAAWTSRLVGALGLSSILLAVGFLLQGTIRLALRSVPTVGQSAPNFQGKTVDGQDVSLSSLRGQVVLLEFWTTTCVGCVGLTPRNNRIARRFAGQGLVVLGVNPPEQDADALHRYIRERPVDYATLIDRTGEILSTFGISSFPTAILLDADGVVRARHLGAVPEGRFIEEIRDLIDRAGRTDVSDLSRSTRPSSTRIPAPRDS